MIGGHVIKCWSSTQASIALSSGEAEFYGVVRAAGIALGQKSLMADLGVAIPARVWTDSSAAMGISARQGLGKLRHIECHTLWVQQRLRQGDFELRKVRGEVNPADLFTKFLESRGKIDQLIALFGCVFRDGRAESAPALRQEGLKNVDSGDFGNDDDGDAYAIDDMQQHDPDTLPHMYNLKDMGEMFPNIKACGEGDFGEGDPQGRERELADPFPVPAQAPVHRPPHVISDDSDRVPDTTTSTTTTSTVSIAPTSRPVTRAGPKVRRRLKRR